MKTFRFYTIALQLIIVAGIILAYTIPQLSNAQTEVESIDEAVELILIEVDIKEPSETLPPPIIVDTKELECLALNIYHEARGSNLADQYAVADVTLNRVHNDRYPDTICEVVKQAQNDGNGNPIRNRCQFSWWCDGKNDKPNNETAWANSQYVAGNIAIGDKFRGITEGSTHYHASYVHPNWTDDRGMNHIGRIGSHIFYRWD